MRKNFMLSLAAMAALPMAGLANTAWSVGPQTEWAKVNESDQDPVFYSAESFYGYVGLTHEGISLPKGKYTLVVGSYTNVDFIITVNGTPLNGGKSYENQIFELSEDTNTVKLELKAKNTEEKFTVDGLKFRLEFDFSEWHDNYTKDLSKVISDIDNVAAGELKTALEKSYNEFDEAIAKMVNDNGQPAFEVYRDYKLYNGKNSDIAQAIVRMSNAAKIFNDANKWKNKLTTDLGNCGDYTKNIYKETVNDKILKLSNILEALPEQYAEGNVAEYNEDAYNEYDNLDKNLKAHDQIKKALDEVQKAYDAHCGTLTNNFKEAYKNLLAPAQKALDAVYATVTQKVEEFPSTVTTDLDKRTSDFTSCFATQRDAMQTVVDNYYSGKTSYYNQMKTKFDEVNTFKSEFDTAKSDDTAFRAIFTDNNNNSAYKTGIPGFADAASTINTCLTNIQSIFNNAMEKVADNEGLVFTLEVKKDEGTVTYVYSNEAKTGELDKALEALGDVNSNIDAANTAVSNYNALKTAVEGVKTNLDAAETTVKGLDTEKKYPQYSAWERGSVIYEGYREGNIKNKGLVDKYNDYKTPLGVANKTIESINTAYKQTCVDKDEATNKTLIEQLNADIEDFKTKATTAFENYKTVKDAIDGWNGKSADIWKIISANTTIPTGEKGSDTYGAAMNQADILIDGYEDNLATAVTMNGAEHYAAMSSLQTEVNGVKNYFLTTPINEIETKYNNQYDKWNNLLAIEMFNSNAEDAANYATNLVSDCNTAENKTYADNDNNKKKYGNRLTTDILGTPNKIGSLADINSQLTTCLQDAVNANLFRMNGFKYEAIKLSESAKPEEVTAYITNLDKYYLELVSLNQTLAALHETAATIATEYKANCDAYTALVPYGLEDEYLGKVMDGTEVVYAPFATQISTIWSSSNDDSRESVGMDLYVAKSNINNQISEFKTAIKQSYETDEDVDKKKEQFKKDLDDIQTAINTFKDTVDASNKNLAAYNSQNATFKKTLMVGDTDMTIAYKEYLNVKAVVNAGHTFYAGKLSDIDSEIAELKQAIQASYDARNSVKDSDTHNNAITKKQNAVNAAVTNCQLNDANYTTLNGQKNGTTAYYNDILKKIQDKDLNTAWVTSMENIQQSMNNTSGSIDDSFAGGALCDSKNVKPYQEAYTNYHDQIGKVWTSWLNGDDTKVGYLQTVLDANNTTHSTFTELVSTVTERYTTVSNNLKKYLGYGVDAAAVATALDDLYAQKTSLDKQQQTESEAFYTLLAENSKLTSASLEAGKVPGVFDAENFTLDVNKILTQINDIYNKVVADQNKKAQGLLSPVVGEASETVKAYKKAIAEAGYYDNKSIVDELDTYFEDVDADLTTANNTWLDSDDLALHCAEYTQTLQKLIDTEDPQSKLSIALANIAETQKGIWKTAIDTKYAEVTGEGGKFETYPDYAEGYKDAYIELYNDVVAQWPETASYAGMEALNELYKSFIKDESINEFLTLVENVDLSKDAVTEIEALETYQHLTTVKNNISSLRGSLSAFAVIYKYAVAYENMNPLDQAAFKVNEFERTFEKYKTQNCVHSKKDELKELLTTINGWYDEGNFRFAVIRSERDFLKEQLIQLKSAINIYDGDDKSDYITKVQNYTTSLDFTGGVHDELIELCTNVQVGIAEDLAALTNFKKADVLDNLQTKNSENNNAFIAVNETYDSLYDFQKKKLQDEKHYAEENTYDQIDKTITANENWLVLCADNLYKRIEESAKNLDNYKIYADNEFNQVTKHEENKERLNKQLQETYKESFDELAELINDFQSEDVQAMFAELTKYYNANVTAQDAWVKKTPESYDDLKKDIDKLTFDPAIEITQQGEAVNAPVRVASSSVDVSSILTAECTSFETFFKNANKELSYKEAKYRIETFSETFPEGYFVANEGEFVYPEAGLDAEYDRIKGLYEALEAYCDAAYSSTVTTEIDGTTLYEKDANGDYVLDEEGNKKELSSLTVDFVDCRQAIFDQVKNLEDALSDYNDMIDNNTGMYGDVDHDKVVDTADYMRLLYHVLEKDGFELTGVNLTAADMNGDKNVDVTDIILLINKILGTPASSSAAPARVAIPCATTTDAVSVMVEGEGVHQRIGIMLDAERVYAGCQMDILLPEGVTLVSESVGEMADGLSLSSNDRENGSHRIILSSLEGMTMTAGNGAILWLDVEVDHNYSGEGIALSNIFFASTTGRTFELSVASGETTGLSNVSMTQEVKEKIYNVGGILMDSLKRGVNIIRGNDGSSKKIVK